MNSYRYRAINEAGKYVNSKIMAENPGDLAALLRDMNLELISYKIERQQLSFLQQKIRPKDLITIFVHLEQLSNAGISIIDAISDLKETADTPQIKNLMQELHESIKNGHLFSESLAKHPETFNHTYVGLIAMGEKTGNLTNSFASIIEDVKWNMEIKRKTRKATVGPLFGILMMFIVLGIMTIIVVPKVTGFLAAQDVGLPLATRSLISFSQFIQSYWYAIIFFIPALWMTLKILAKSEEIAVKLDDFKLKLPIIGNIMTKIDAAKFCQFFGMTFRSGLGVIECLEASSQVIKNKAIKRSIIAVKQQVSDGQSIAAAIASTRYFPSLVIRMFKVGEESGNMENSLQNIKFFYDREINDSIDRLVSMIQPTLTIVMGGMIAWITISVFGPIYSTFSKMN